jgi:hypothetical protein
MRKLLPVLFLFLLLLFIPVAGPSISGQSRRIPPGIREGDKVMNAQLQDALPPRL